MKPFEGRRSLIDAALVPMDDRVPRNERGLSRGRRARARRAFLDRSLRDRDAGRAIPHLLEAVGASIGRLCKG